MQYDYPERVLAKLRCETAAESSSWSAISLRWISASLEPSAAASKGYSSSLRFPWLRTVTLGKKVVSPTHTDMSTNAPSDLPAIDLQNDCYGVERIILRSYGPLRHSLWRLSDPCPSSTLRTLSMRDVDYDSVNDSFLLAVAGRYPELECLHLPGYATNVTQRGVNDFHHLVELDVSWCYQITDVHFCAKTLRVLYADSCKALTDAGLEEASSLRILHVEGCAKVTTVEPFALSLRELNATGACGIGSEALSQALFLQVLYVSRNLSITHLEPFARHLRELHAAGFNHLKDDSLLGATSLVCLDAGLDNMHITTVAPFAETLRVLNASGRASGLSDEGLSHARHLVSLDSSFNAKIRSVAPFGGSLRKLTILGKTMDDAALTAAPRLHWLNVSHNEEVTTVEPFASSLRHLYVKSNECGVGDVGLVSAVHLATLDCFLNPKVTTLRPFEKSLWRVQSYGSGIPVKKSSFADAVSSCACM